MEPLALSYEWLVFLIFWSRMNYPESGIDCALRRHIRRAPRDGGLGAGSDKARPI